MKLPLRTWILALVVCVACTAPPVTPSITSTVVSTTTPTSVLLQSPVATQMNLMYAFGATDTLGRAYPGWMLVSEAPTTRIIAMAAGDIVSITPITFGRTAFLRIQLRTARYDIEYVIASMRAVAAPPIQLRQHVHTGDVLHEVALIAPEYVAISVIDREARTRVCPRDFIDSHARDALAQQIRHVVNDWCQAAQLPYSDEALLLPLQQPTDVSPQVASASPEPSQLPTTQVATKALVVTPTHTVHVALTAITTTPLPHATTTPVPAHDDAIGALVYPVRDINQIHIMEAFSTDASAPWGFAHNGIDFMTAHDRETVLASAHGTITHVDLFRFPPRNNWQVNISLRVNERYTIGYAIEPMRSDDATGAAQQALIIVKEGQMVAAGDVLGELIGGENGAHIHWGINDNTINQAICPAPFLSTTQQAELLARIPSQPDRLCYP